jgi:predicted nucleic acid-binding protein
MKVFVDTNVFVASLTDEPERGSVATSFLDEDHEFYTSLLNLMELRTVLEGVIELFAWCWFHGVGGDTAEKYALRMNRVEKEYVRFRAVHINRRQFSVEARFR